MAHENLKFRVNLNDNTSWQPIFGSQDYGTFYMVYIKIKQYSKIKTEKKDVIKHTYCCDFKLQNYRGQITMGFTEGYIPQLTFPNGNNPDEEGVHALVNLKISPFTINELLEDIKLYELQPLKGGMTIQTNFEREIPPGSLYNRDKPEKSKYLNPYRFVRDGEAYSEISARKFKQEGKPDAFQDPGQFGCWVGPCIPNRWTIFE